jgi:hypothetical protein|tara:strand:+ start:571 stop:732 length:162 start_codon:yes stop_codon:yes gene_type:complete
MAGRKKSIVTGGSPVRHRGLNLTDMRRYLVQTQGKVVSIDQLKKFVDTLPNKK